MVGAESSSAGGPEVRPGFAPGEAPSATGPTGDETVDDALRELAALSPEAALTEQLSVLTDVHEALHRRLTATDS